MSRFVVFVFAKICCFCICQDLLFLYLPRLWTEDWLTGLDRRPFTHLPQAQVTDLVQAGPRWSFVIICQRSGYICNHLCPPWHPAHDLHRLSFRLRNRQLISPSQEITLSLLFVLCHQCYSIVLWCHLKIWVKSWIPPHASFMLRGENSNVWSDYRHLSKSPLVNYADIYTAILVDFDHFWPSCFDPPELS